MTTEPESRLAALLDRLALFLAILGVVLRLMLHAATAGSGANLFVHLLFWISTAAWFGGRALAGGTAFRFTGLEFAFIAFAIASLVSVLRASYRLPAMEMALRDLSFALLFVLAVNALGARTLLSLLLPALLALSVHALLQVALLFPQVDPSTLPIEMARRIRTHEPWATFRGPNQLAGFLALLLPIAAGAARDSRIRWPGGVVLGSGIVALVLTGSLGAWVALGTGAAVFAVLAFTRTRGRRTAVFAGSVAAALVLLLALATPLLDRVAEKSFSIHVRLAYWRAARTIIAGAPWAGVGLDNYRERYFAAKPETPQETTYAHDDYLQILAETGVFGFLAFAGLLALGLRKALVKEAGPPDGLPERPRPQLLASALGFVVAIVAAASYRDPIELVTWIVTGACFLGAQALLRFAAPEPALPWTRIGAAAGFCALLVHMTVEFDVYEPGVAMTMVLVLALLAALRGDAAELRLPRAACAATAGLLGIVALPLLIGVVPRWMAAEAEMEAARRGDRDAARVAAAAAQHHPLNADAHELAAHLKFTEWMLLRPRAVRDEQARILATEAEETALHYVENAIRLRPLSSPLHDRMATFHRQFRGLDLELVRTLPGRTSAYEGQAQDHLRRAVAEEEQAVALYPSYGPLRYSLARLLDEDGRPMEALDHYREALRLSGLVDRELWSTDRMKVPPLARARCLVRLGERAKAVALLASTPTPAPDELAAEWDDLMRPVIEEARKGIMPPDSSRGRK